MKALLITKGLWPGVMNPENTDECGVDGKGVGATSRLNVQKHLLGQVAACANAKVAWDELQKTYKSKNNARKLCLRQEMAGLKMESGERVVKYVARARDLYRDSDCGRRWDEARGSWLASACRAALIVCHFENDP